MGSHEFEEWKAEYRRKPWGRESELLATLTHLIHKADFKAPHPTIESLLGVETKPQTPEQMWATLMAFSQVHNASSGTTDGQLHGHL